MADVQAVSNSEYLTVSSEEGMKLGHEKLSQDLIA